MTDKKVHAVALRHCERLSSQGTCPMVWKATRILAGVKVVWDRLDPRAEVKESRITLGKGF